jgi:hypothetical protein
MFRIIIPTRGRTNTQLTISFFPKELREITTVVAPQKEMFKLSKMYFDHQPEYVAQPDPDWTIAEKRAWIFQWAHEQGYDKIFMLDDDLRFSTRISEGDWHLREIAGKELMPEFERIRDKLGPEFPHVGLGQRQGNQTLKEVGWKVPGKMCYALGYHVPTVMKECIFNRVALREDMELSLQLLLKGYPNAIWTQTVTDQREYGGGKKFDKTGGCGIERTVEKSNAEAKKLAELFPGYVSITQREYEASIPRLEVIVQWQKALQDGLAKRASTKASSVG